MKTKCNKLELLYIELFDGSLKHKKFCFDLDV